MFTRLCCLCSAMMLALLSLASISSAQSTFGTVIGNVTDASGSAIANTQITLTNAGTNEKRTATTNSDGLYQFVNVQPGQYTVEVAQSGFKRLVRGPFSVETQSTAQIDVALQVGDVTQTVEVTAQTPLL